MPATFLYTLFLGIIYLAKKNWNAHSRKKADA